MTKVIDMAAIRESVKATEAKLVAKAQEDGDRNARLLDLLNVIEKDLTDKQQQINHLEEENEQLTDLLHDTLTMVNNAEECRSQQVAGLEQLIDRLGTTPSKMNHDAEEDVLELIPLVQDDS